MMRVRDAENFAIRCAGKENNENGRGFSHATRWGRRRLF
jgi:hypothetical protein